MANRTIYISNMSIWRQAKLAARQRNVSLSALIESLLAQFLYHPLPFGD